MPSHPRSFLRDFLKLGGTATVFWGLLARGKVGVSACGGGDAGPCASSDPAPPGPRACLAPARACARRPPSPCLPPALFHPLPARGPGEPSPPPCVVSHLSGNLPRASCSRPPGPASCPTAAVSSAVSSSGCGSGASHFLKGPGDPSSLASSVRSQRRLPYRRGDLAGPPPPLWS